LTILELETAILQPSILADNMFYDETIAEFVSGSRTFHVSSKLAPPGLPSMYPVISQPLAPSNRMDLPVKRWGRDFDCNSQTTRWVPLDLDEFMADKLEEFQGEESLVPESIPDELWQTHFRQHDSELNDRKETEFLLLLYKQSSGRWPVIYDRWQSHSVYGLRGKSLEALKSKFNKIAMKLLEIDLLQRKRPATTMERFQFLQELKYLPIFSMKYNEKNEYLRRIFLDNAYKKPNSVDQEKMVGEIMRGPNLAIKKKNQQSRPQLTPGPHLSKSLITSVQTEISGSEATRMRSMLAGLGISISASFSTPRIAKMLAVIEKETLSLLMMRDSLQRKKQELEILRTSGGTHAMHRARQPAPPPAGVAHSISINQQKRKR
jgi:hypothetical protein